VKEMNWSKFEKTDEFFAGLKDLFASLNVPVNYLDEKSLAPNEILAETFRKNVEAYQLMDDVFVLGMVDNAAFKGEKSETIDSIEKGKKDYDGILIFGVTLKNRDEGLLPTRSQLSEITRAFNREFHYTPVVVVLKYEHYISIANAERIAYKQEWREGEKAGKVSILRDINVKQPHTGHLRILQELTICRAGKGAVNTFAELYTYWQSVFNVSILNKKFYKELSDWYFWALHEVVFPVTSYAADKTSLLKDDELVKEHNAKNLIRMLTRLLFVWFVKEKNLIPEELFDKKSINDNLINGFEPSKKKDFDHKTQGSKYYRAILQNLFFATLNQTVGKREFRKGGQQMNITNLMRYESYFKNPKAFIKLVDDVVPFMNGGLFECLDSPDPLLKGKWGGDVIIYEDGFSDREDNSLCVPDYIFFGTDEHADLSRELGDKKHKDVTVNGLINILNSYKFTVTENTPIEQDVALDPELLGKVFENLLASYNPETKTTEGNR
jgi:adenine-specific DNA-methyltransferase